MRKVKVAAVQMRCTENVNENIANAEKLVREAAMDGASTNTMSLQSRWRRTTR